MKSLLFQNVIPYQEPPACASLPCRQEVGINVRKGSRTYYYTLRDRILPEDAYLMMVKAAAFAIASNEPYAGRPPARSVRDFIVKDSLTT